MERRAQSVCLLVGLICIFPVIFLTPPFQVPDEPQHFYRAYQISELNLIASVENGRAGGSLPSSLIQLTSKYLNSREIHDSRPVVKHSRSFIFETRDVPLEPQRREFIDFSGSAFYSPLAYLPQVIAIAAGRLFEASPLILMYLARITNAAVAIITLSFAIRIVPRAKAAFLVAGLLPMSIYLYGSISADASVIATAFLFIALSLRAYEEKRWPILDLVAAIVCGTIFCTVKIVYAPLLLIGFASFFSTPRLKSFLVPQLAIVIIPILITYAWLKITSGLVVPVKIGINVPAQLQYVVIHPLLFLSAITQALVKNNLYFFTTIGVLGWLSVKLSPISYILPVVASAYALLGQRGAVPSKNSAAVSWWCALGVSCLILVMLALYLYWNVVAATIVDGVQGRYLIPILPIFMYAIDASGVGFNRKILQVSPMVFVTSVMCFEGLLTMISLRYAFWE